MFRREQHQRIDGLLHGMKADLLQQAECYFGGGTAIVLLLDEYRESVDVDFLCASADGYRLLRNAIYERGLEALFVLPPDQLRELRADQYGIRCVLQVDGAPIKFEIVREARVALSGGIDGRLGVPVLSRVDMFAEKLLANADRGLDRATLSRDLIDLAMMIDAWEGIPAEAWEKAKFAYGDSVERLFFETMAKNSSPDYLRRCGERMQMSEAAILTVQRVIAHMLKKSRR
jgi:hypothetical protein